MKKLPLGIQNFKEIINEGYIYVDKTKYIYDLITGLKYCFLSRPRRFGKSLLLDTIAEVFNGDKDLFKGLWIYDSDYSFKKHPVIRLDMGSIPNDSPDILNESLLDELTVIAECENLKLSSKNSTVFFKRLITALFTKYNQRVVVLIDEYDKPILDHISETEIAEANRKVIKSFYEVLKSTDSCLRFVMLTGVTKLSIASVFSGLNNLVDISLRKKYAGICGIPVDSLKEYFDEHIKNHELQKTMTRMTDCMMTSFDGMTDIHGTARQDC
jgi:hypothetical protein